VLGEAKKVEAFGQQRLAVFFHRLIMPDGYSVSLDQFKGLNQIGETALRDKVNNHYLQIFGASLAVGFSAEFPRPEPATYSRARRSTAHARDLVRVSRTPRRKFSTFLKHPAYRDDPRGQPREDLSVGDLLLPDYAGTPCRPDL